MTTRCLSPFSQRTNLSDRQVVQRAQTDVAYRLFLGLGLSDGLPDSSTLSYLRGRLGVEGHQRIFQDLLAQTRDKLLLAAEGRAKVKRLSANHAKYTCFVLDVVTEKCA